MLPYPPDVISDLVAESINQLIERTTANQMLTAKMRQILDESIKWCLERNRKSLLHVRDYITNLKGDIQTRDGILARADFILNNEVMKQIICGKDSLKWGEMIQRGQSFILDCFGMSEEKMIFLGTLITQQLKAYFRHERPREYKPLRVYIDEVHNFLSSNLLNLLKEGRKFKLGFVMATVDFSNIPPHLVHALCNVGSLIAFKVGAREATILAREIGVTPQELQFPERFEFHYLTPRDRGKAKALSPPIVIKREPPKGKVAPQRKAKVKWFPLESDYQPVAPISGQ